MPHKPADQDDSANKAPSATNRALILLGHKARSAAELRRKLAEEGYDDAAQDVALAAVRTWGYVHDGRLAEAASAAATRQGRGAAWLKKRLVGRQLEGVDLGAVAQAHASHEPALLDALLRRRFADAAALAEQPKLRARAVRFLLGRGFAYANVVAALRRHGAGAAETDDATFAGEGEGDDV